MNVPELQVDARETLEPAQLSTLAGTCSLTEQVEWGDHVRAFDWRARAEGGSTYP